MSSVTLGGERLGAGNKQKIELKNYERSSHDLGYTWRSTMAPGTLVPFMSQVALPGDTWDIDLGIDIQTLPTVGALFGSYKVQLDVFEIPVRLFQGKLHMNMVGVGLEMDKIKLPQIHMFDNSVDKTKINDNSQINPSSIFKYLGISGLGIPKDNYGAVERYFNAIPYLSYWSVYKQYYANKQEEIGVVVHNPMNEIYNPIVSVTAFTEFSTTGIGIGSPAFPPQTFTLGNGRLEIKFTEEYEVNPETIAITYDTNTANPLPSLFSEFTWDSVNNILIATEPKQIIIGLHTWKAVTYNPWMDPIKGIPQLSTFPLSNIDEMRQNILTHVKDSSPFIINQTVNTPTPYSLALAEGVYGRSRTANLEGLGIKTYQSDLFNNWVSTEWIDGENGINAITSVDTTSGSFTMDTLNLASKVYDMMNRIAVSGGTYDDWLNSVYTHERTKGAEEPIYHGGLIKELAFQEVINQSAGTYDGQEQPLGALAGRGVLTHKHKGGKIRIKTNEISYLLGIVSLTPRLDYSQGNSFDVNLETLNDFHKPQLDEIGFQDLSTELMAWWDVECEPYGTSYKINRKSAGKQPAWINYMTNVNKCYGEFAVRDSQMYMTLNRRYTQNYNGDKISIKDLTSYCDPSHFNYVFSNTRLDAQNFMVQIGVDALARRKMSARVMPNL